MSNLDIRDDLSKWFYELKSFINLILLEDDKEYIDKVMMDTFQHHQTDVYTFAEFSKWLKEYQKFKSFYKWYPHNLDNMMVAALYVHTNNTSKAENIVKNYLKLDIRYTLSSDVLNTSILVDKDFMKNVEKFLEIWNDPAQHN